LAPRNDILVPVIGEILKGKRDRFTMLILIIVLLLLFGGGGGYYGHSRWGPSGGVGVGLGTVLLIVLIVFLLGGMGGMGTIR
jgi:hypothetical protein